jgi:hypothetical protein
VQDSDLDTVLLELQSELHEHTLRIRRLAAMKLASVLERREQDTPLVSRLADSGPHRNVVNRQKLHEET